MLRGKTWFFVRFNPLFRFLNSISQENPNKILSHFLIKKADWSKQITYHYHDFLHRIFY